MLKREDILTKTIPEIQEVMTNDVTEFTAALETKTLDELKGIEAELMVEMQEDDKHLEEVAYELADSAEFDGTKVNSDKIAEKIVGFLDRLEVEWRATLGIYQAIKFWRKEFEGTVTYPVFDTTLRLLGTLKFKGEVDCKNVLLINNWFSTAHKDYAIDNVWKSYLAAKHQAIMQAMQSLQEAENPTEEGAEASADTQI